ncbi:MAG TPA: 6-bladed beta-propeller [Longimicrobium sp.]|nr:6-bladed beta-propeller [Longimicrobium sp.]
MSNPRLPLARLALMAFLPLAACSRGGEPRTVQVDSLPGGGVVVRNPAAGAWTDASAWRAVEDLRIGAAEGEGPDVFAMPAAVEVDAHGRLYVLEAATGQVRVFGADGGHVRSMGRQGAGPGELAQPVGMALAPDGTLWVVDPGNGRFTVFDTAGALRTTVRRDNGFAAFPWPGRFDRQGRLWDVALGTGAPGAVPALLRLDPASGRAERLALPAFTPEQFVARRGGITSTAPVPFSPALVWTLDADGRVWSGVTEHYRLHLHHPAGDTLRTVERAGPRVPVTAAERDALPVQLKWFTDQGGSVELSRVPSHKPAFVAVTTDDRGWLWVRPSLPESATNTQLDVFSPDGVYQGRLALPVLVPENMPLVVRSDRIYAVVLSEDDVPGVVRFRIDGRDAADAASGG